MRSSCLVGLLVLGCSSDKAAAPAAPAPSGVTAPVAPPRTSAPGTGNIHGVVTFADKPVGGIAVTLCRTMGSIAGCGDVVAKTTTGADGGYTFADVPVGTYGGTAAQVFDSDRYVFMAKVIPMTGEGVAVTEGGLTEVSPLGLFKDDLALGTPKVSQKVDRTNLTVTWPAYPDASSYVLYFGEVRSGEGVFYVEQTTKEPTHTFPGPLAPGKYSYNVAAFSAKGDMISTGKSRVFVVR